MKRADIITALALFVSLCALAEEPPSTKSVPVAGPSHAASPQPSSFSAGIIFGEPTGASLKYWFNDTMAIDGAIGFSTHDESDLYLHSDVLWHNFDLIPVSRGALPVYLGVGGLVRSRDDDHDNQVGIRVPVGISYLFDNAPVEVFAEVGPALDVAPDVRGEVTGGIGVRYRF